MTGVVSITISTWRDGWLLEKHTKCSLQWEIKKYDDYWHVNKEFVMTYKYRSSKFWKHKHHAIAACSEKYEFFITSKCHFAAVNNCLACSAWHPAITTNWLIITCSLRLSITWAIGDIKCLRICRCLSIHEMSSKTNLWLTARLVYRALSRRVKSKLKGQKVKILRLVAGGRSVDVRPQDRLCCSKMCKNWQYIKVLLVLQTLKNLERCLNTIQKRISAAYIAVIAELLRTFLRNIRNLTEST